MKYLAVLGREPILSLAELEALFNNVQQIAPNLATFEPPKTSRKPKDDSFSTRPLEPVGLRPFASQGANVNGLEGASLGSLCIARLGGTLKLATPLDQKPLDYLSNLPDGKITFGLSDYSARASKKSVSLEALKFKKILARHGRSVRVVPSDGAILSTATSLHNGLSGKNPKKVELLKFDNTWYRVVGIQDIDAYTRRDQARPARDARVGMLPPKLAQILINLCGPLPLGSRILDPFCGTGVVLQEANLMGYCAYGTDINERMVEYSRRNLEWLEDAQNNISRAVSSLRSLHPKGQTDIREDIRGQTPLVAGERTQDELPQASPVSEKRRLGNSDNHPIIEVGDATNFTWTQPIDAVACEAYLGQPMSTPPVDIKLKSEKQRCKEIILGFFKNLAPQITPGTPVVVAVPAWLRENGTYSRLEILDLLPDMGYNVSNRSREGLLYYREGQIVARDIIILRKT